MTPVKVIYGFCGIGLLLASGGTICLSRLAYGIVPLNIAIGLLLSRHPRQGYLILGGFCDSTSQNSCRICPRALGWLEGLIHYW